MVLVEFVLGSDCHIQLKRYAQRPGSRCRSFSLFHSQCLKHETSRVTPRTLAKLERTVSIASILGFHAMLTIFPCYHATMHHTQAYPHNAGISYSFLVLYIGRSPSYRSSRNLVIQPTTATLPLSPASHSPGISGSARTKHACSTPAKC